jgi:hypothetical protein
LIELKPYGQCTVNMATSRTMAIGMLAKATNAPAKIIAPPRISTAIVANDMR